MNVRGLRDKLKRKKVILWLKQKCDIAFLQETYWTNELETRITSDWNGRCIFNHGTNHSKGVAVLIKKELDLNIVNTFVMDVHIGRAIGFRFIYNKKSFLCLNVYAPAKNSEKIYFIKHLSIGLIR